MRQLTHNPACFTHARTRLFSLRWERSPLADSPSGRCASSARRWGRKVLVGGSRSRSAASTTPLRTLRELCPQAENRSRSTSLRSAATSRRGRLRAATESTSFTPPQHSSRCRLAMRLRLRPKAVAAARRWPRTRARSMSAQAQCAEGASLGTRAAALGCESTPEIWM